MAERRRKKGRVQFLPLLGLVTLLLVLWGEWLCYRVSSLRWPSMSVAPSRDDAVRLLLVADPQIQGYLSESQTLGPLTRWDADRYLRQTFSLAFDHVQPHAVVFLGDLMDEGSIANHRHYTDYFKRIMNIFYKAKDNKAQMIFIPGDNDVGGEGQDYKTQENIMRFSAHFDTQGYHTVQYVDILHMDIDYKESYAGEKREDLDNMGSMLSKHLRLGINHHPMLARTGGNLLEAMQRHKIQLLFTAHDHTAAMFTCEGCHQRDVSSPIKPVVRSLNRLDHWVDIDIAGGSMWEIMLPTCSYRMAEPAMGYAVAVIKPNGKVLFSILWSASRFPQLYTYILLVAALGLYCVYVGLESLRKQREHGKRMY